MNPILPIFNALNLGIRWLSVGNVITSRNHYDVLGLTPKATQKDIKDAYYKLSMLYHPDKNKDSEEAASKFRSITEAYEVLGNVKLRKLYDKGASNIGRSIEYDSKYNAAAKFHKAREVRSKPPTPSGRTPIYDFDEWSRAHYGATFARDMEIKRMLERERLRQKMDNNDIKVEKVLFVMTAMMCFFVIMSYTMQNADNVRYSKDKYKSDSATKDKE